MANTSPLAPFDTPAAAPSRRRVLLLASLAVAGGLGGCGFALRGRPNFAFKSLRLRGSEGTSVARELRSALEEAGVRVFTSAVPASPEGETGEVVLTVLGDQRERAVVGQSTDGEVREIQLRTRFRYRLTTARGVMLNDNVELLVEREISYTETAALAKQTEEELYYQDMLRDITQQAMRRLAAVKLP